MTTTPETHCTRHGTTFRCWTMLIGATLLIIAPLSDVSAMAPFKTGENQTVGFTLNCSNAVMTTAPTFLSNPKGSAKYPFRLQCVSPDRPGIMSVFLEGSWTPSETRRDRPNASESVTVTGYEPWFPNRAPGGKIFMYWTGSCTADPWLQGGACSRFGEYVPDDLREIFKQFISKPFPLTGKSISAKLKQQLIAQYQAANQPKPAQMPKSGAMAQMIESPKSQAATQSQAAQATTAPPQAALPKASVSIGALSRSGLFARGVEGESATEVETTDSALLEDGTPDAVEPMTLTLDKPLYVVTAKGDAAVLKPGTYEIAPTMDVQLALVKEGEQAVLLHAQPSTHSQTITRTLAMTILGQGDHLYLVVLTPDGRRFDAVGSTTGVKFRGVDQPVPFTDTTLQDAIHAAAKVPTSGAQACRPNPADTGPRWLPVPCAFTTAGPNP